MRFSNMRARAALRNEVHSRTFSDRQCCELASGRHPSLHRNQQRVTSFSTTKRFRASCELDNFSRDLFLSQLALTP
jgi:hypothetical protein